MNVKKVLPIILILIVSIIYSCKKELYDSGAANTNLNLENVNDLKKGFSDKNYADNLMQHLNDTLQINWKVNWDSHSTAVINDTLTYYYFELTPKYSNPKLKLNEKTVQEVNIKKFLIVGKSTNKKFYRVATYHFGVNKTKKTAISSIGKNYSLVNFSGQVIYQNLDLKTNNAVFYSNGSKIADPNIPVLPKQNSALKSNYTIPECYTEFDCTFYGSCDGEFQVTATTAKDDCEYPTYYPYTCTFFEGWDPGTTTTKEICHIVEYPDPPIVGGPDPQQPSDPNKKPCPGDPIGLTNIARSAPGNINGGRFGNTRVQLDGTTRFHGGVDILAQENTALYPVMAGTVVRIINNVPADTYVSSRSFGNLIEIESTLPTGEKIRTLYGHLNKIATTLQVGSTIAIGTSLGLTGRTGNAAKGYSPHVHIQTRVNGTLVNPEPYLRTKFSANGTPTVTPC